MRIGLFLFRVIFMDSLKLYHKQLVTNIAGKEESKWKKYFWKVSNPQFSIKVD